MTKVCCVCQRVEHGKYWKDEGEYQLAIDERVTHGYCPLCFDVVMSDLMEYIGEKHPEVNEGGAVSSVYQPTSACA